MRKSSVQAIFRALNDAGVRYLVAGGLAVVAHGYARFTADLDLILDLEPNNVDRALKVLDALGYQPRAPVALSGFADPAMRADWRTNKGLIAFSLHSSQHPKTEIDLFIDAPLKFESAYRSGLRLDLAPDVTATFVSYPDLVDLKTKAGRPRDVEDIEALRRLRGEVQP